ncbi:NAD(P)-binding protein [Polychaeton citri CBS 116435]|uniref:NAD(P)-binding protein n=1 Tax=Polychaeton citri CBS 116435 TaxID=1314669 RepID=A0A9P4Q824_9PEZI|nr:NAD(P)-binding protein [Polychaeton citri CBS 116435]
MPLTILSDHDVNKILHSLTRDDILELQANLADALHWYSTSNDANDCCSDFQPERTNLKRKDGSTTLFMPASSLDGQGIKVVNIDSTDGSGPRLPSVENLSLNSRTSTASTASSSPRNSISTLDSTATSSSNSTAQTSVSGSTVNSSDKYATKDTSSAPTKSTIRGSLTLMDAKGQTYGLINAEEVTAFRTALASTMLLRKRHSVHDVTIFGAGKQAYWHVRLALLLRGEEIHHLNIVTRNFDSARNLIMRLYDPQPDDPDYVNTIGAKYNSRTQKNILTPMHTEYQRLIKEYVRGSNVIFCTVPSKSPLFPATYLTNPEGRKKGRYIVCIGSYKPDMIELHPDVLRYAVAPHHEHRHIHKRQREGGAVVVDTVTGCLKEAGEVIQAKLTPDQVVELGELFMLKREAERRLMEKGIKPSSEPDGKGCQVGDTENKGLHEWLSKGNVIYKSVGLGLMDVTVGGDLVRLARQRGVGVTIEHF